MFGIDRCSVYSGVLTGFTVYNNIVGILTWKGFSPVCTVYNNIVGILTWKGFSPVCTNWCRFNFELSTKALPHSAQTCTLGPCVWRCLRMAELSRNILLQPCNVIFFLIMDKYINKCTSEHNTIQFYVSTSCWLILSKIVTYNNRTDYGCLTPLSINNISLVMVFFVFNDLRW